MIGTDLSATAPYDDSFLLLSGRSLDLVYREEVFLYEGESESWGESDIKVSPKKPAFLNIFPFLFCLFSS